jgi:hypothetical protein
VRRPPGHLAQRAARAWRADRAGAVPHSIA